MPKWHYLECYTIIGRCATRRSGVSKVARRHSSSMPPLQQAGQSHCESFNEHSAALSTGSDEATALGSPGELAELLDGISPALEANRWRPGRGWAEAGQRPGRASSGPPAGASSGPPAGPPAGPVQGPVQGHRQGHRQGQFRGQFRATGRATGRGQFRATGRGQFRGRSVWPVRVAGPGGRTSGRTGWPDRVAGQVAGPGGRFTKARHGAPLARQWRARTASGTPVARTDRQWHARTASGTPRTASGTPVAPRHGCR
jgi:hypothetical protein